METMADSNPSSSVVMPISLSVSLAGFLAATLALLYLWHKYSGPGEFTKEMSSILADQWRPRI
jgi:hypothetical protein